MYRLGCSKGATYPLSIETAKPKRSVMITVHKTTLDGVHHPSSLAMAPKLKGKIHAAVPLSSMLPMSAKRVSTSTSTFFIPMGQGKASSRGSNIGHILIGMQLYVPWRDDAIVKALGVDGEFGYASVDSRKVLCIHDPFPGVAIYRLDGTFHIEGSELKVRTREGHLTKTNLISLLAIPSP
ncbi:hypothetical protein B0H14DRAFT_2641156 [Mycena olivaceomarginata]|nr:hypothetical protein B0H14DRAFT_2641156 [Mycena olivaceomarginata]